MYARSTPDSPHGRYNRPPRLLQDRSTDTKMAWFVSLSILRTPPGRTLGCMELEQVAGLTAVAR